jgi:hypothetical protein
VHQTYDKVILFILQSVSTPMSVHYGKLLVKEEEKKAAVVQH